MQKLLEVQAGNLLSSGVFPALEGAAPPLWADGENVIFLDGEVRKNDGLVGLANIPARPTGLKEASILGARNLYVGAGGAYYRYTTGAGLVLLQGGFSAGGIWQFLPVGDTALVSNGVEDLHFWNGAADVAVVTPFTRARTIFQFRKQAFAIDDQNIVYYSEIADFLDWVATLNGAAGQLSLSGEIDGQLLAAHLLGAAGQQVMLYTEGSSGLWTYVGGTVRFDFKLTVPGCGAAAQYAVVPVGERQYTFSRNRFMETDGISFRYIDEPAVRRFVEQMANQGRSQEVTSWHDQPNSMVRWVIPSGADGFIRLGFNYVSRRWKRQNDGSLIGEKQGTWPEPFVAKQARLLSQVAFEPDNDGDAFAAFVQTKPLDCGDRQQCKRIDKIVLDLSKTGSVKFQLAFLDDPKDTVVFQPEVYEAESGDNFLTVDDDVNLEGQYIVLKLFSEALGVRWKLGGFSLWGEFTGVRN